MSSTRFFGAIKGALADRRTNGGRPLEWARILAYITGTVDQELLLRNEYLAAENRILRGQLKGRLKLSDAERAKLGEIGRRLGRKALGEVATAALPDNWRNTGRADQRRTDSCSCRNLNPKILMGYSPPRIGVGRMRPIA